ncbi:hypothetical protein AB0J74_01585 [Asanoa sp. NPDC049573]|uniref:hypothetical protein n=1 Tax=Asanoa sp. NPDC049573 TaxID=3155396 RepID=UPI00344ACD78
MIDTDELVRPNAAFAGSGAFVDLPLRSDLAAFPELLAEFFEIQVAELDSKAVLDPRTAVAIDGDIMRRAQPPGTPVVGLVYDVHTGLVEVAGPHTER